MEVMDSESSIQMNSHPRGKFNPPWMFHAQELLCVRLRLSVNIPGMSVYTQRCSLSGDSAMLSSSNAAAEEM